MRELLAVHRRRQFTRFHSGLQAVDNGLVNLCVHLSQLFMDRIAVCTNFRAEIADEASVSKVGLLEKLELNIEPLAKTIKRLERVVPKGLRDVLLNDREIANKEFETERLFRCEVIRE